jgi:hypothetical protein
MRRPQAPPISLVAECFALDADSPTELRWRERPRWHFSTARGWAAWNRRFANRPILGSPNNKGELRVGLTFASV